MFVTQPSVGADTCFGREARIAGYIGRRDVGWSAILIR
jgi:hypothetical protein